MSCSGIDGDFCFNVTTVGDKAIEENEVEELKEIIDFQNDITPNLVIKSSEEGDEESSVLLKKGADCYAKADYQQALRFFHQSLGNSVYNNHLSHLIVKLTEFWLKY